MWACERFSHYLCGLESFRQKTDHQPLVPLINQQDLDKVPLRCHRLLMRLMRFNPKAEYLPGKELVLADTLSRNPLSNPPETSDTEEDVKAYVDAAEMMRLVSMAKMESIKSAISNDPQLSHVLDYTVNDWPKYAKDVPEQLRPSHAVRGSLSVVDVEIIYQNRLVIRPALQPEILERIHDGYQSVTKCRKRANTSVFIHNKVSNCDFCQENIESQGLKRTINHYTSP